MRQWGGLLVALALASGVAQASTNHRPRVSEKAPQYVDPDTAEKVVEIVPEWKELYPFSERFAIPDRRVSGAHVLDLAAARFTTDDLRTTNEKGERVFSGPDLSSFSRQLVREPFAHGDSDLFIVQAASPDDQVRLRQWLASAKVRILGYVPYNAYVVRLSSAQLAKAEQRNEVFYVTLFQPALLVHPKLDYIIEASPDHPMKMRANFDATLFPSAQSVRDALAAVNLEILDITRRDDEWTVRFKGAASEARNLAAIAGLKGVERAPDPKLHNNIARTSADIATGRGASSGPLMDVEDVWDRGIRGEGQIVAAADTGLSTGSLSSLHNDFGVQGSTSNPMRVIKGYALGRSTWDDDGSIYGGHGTHTSGSIVGNGVRSGADPANNSFPSTSFAGNAPKAQFVIQSVMDSSGNLGGIPADLTTLFQAPYNDGARVHSNSWGADSGGAYDSMSQDLDRFVWNNKDMVITFSAGNEGVDGKYINSSSRCVTNGKAIDGIIDTDSIGSPGTAKNAITVGASENYRPDFVYEYPQNDCTSTGGVEQKTWGWFSSCAYSTSPLFGDLMADNASGMGAFSSRGPCDDGRIKPDIVAPGIAIISTRTDKNQTYEQWGICQIPTAQRPYYMAMGGTSMANPLTAGAAVLVRQYYTSGWHPNHSKTTNSSANASDGFSPSAALVKATLINGAWDMNPGQFGTSTTQEIPASWDSTSTLPNNVEGYGRVDVEHSLFPGSASDDDSGRRLEVHDVTAGLQTGGSTDATFEVSSDANPLVVTLVWTDPYASTGSGTKLVNDLDLTVTSPGGTVYYPNGVDRTSGVDRKNNVEQVKVSTPASGTWAIRVSGYNVPGNGVSGTTTQPYALVISGVSTGAPTPNLSLSAAPATLATPIGGSSTVTITTAVSGGFSSAVAVSVSGLPSGASASPGSTSIPAPGAGTSTLTLNAGTAAAGTYGLTLTGTGGGLTRTATVSWTITGGVTTLFTDGFEGTGWSTTRVSGTKGTWTLAASGTHPSVSPHGAAKLALFNSYTAASGNKTRLYRSTGFAIASTYTTVTLKVWMYHDTGYSTRDDTVQAQISTNGSTWTSVGSLLHRYDGSTGWKQHTIDISSSKGSSAVRVGFLGTSAYGNDEYLDDVTVVAQ